jgi:hypothetical protein
VRLRQVALVARELEPVVGEICAALGIEVAYRDPGVAAFGLHNAVMPVGDGFLEVVSPVREDTAAARYLARRGGDAGYMVIVQSDDLAADRKRVEALGVRVVWEVTLDDIATIHLHPRDLGGAIVSLDEPHPPEAWRWAGPRWREHVRSRTARAIAGVEIGAADPGAQATRWAEVLGRKGALRRAGAGGEIALEPGCIRFTPAQDERSQGVVGVDLLAADRGRVGEELVLCGTRFRLV